VSGIPLSPPVCVDGSIHAIEILVAQTDSEWKQDESNEDWGGEQKDQDSSKLVWHVDPRALVHGNVHYSWKGHHVVLVSVTVVVRLFLFTDSLEQIKAIHDRPHKLACRFAAQSAQERLITLFTSRSHRIHVVHLIRHHAIIGWKCIIALNRPHRHIHVLIHSITSITSWHFNSQIN